jgi:RNA polymerase sigma factor (sigma-70 family)
MRALVDSLDGDDGRDVPVSDTMTQALRANERGLLLRYREGDSAAFAELVRQYRAPVFSYLVRCGVHADDRDDLFQEIFIKLHASARQYQADRPLHPWLFTIVANTVRSYVRKRQVRKLLFAEPATHDPASPAPDGERVSAARQTLARLEQRIRLLPLVQREVLLLTCIENLPQQQVARVLKMPVNTVKTHLRRARLALARQLAEGGSRTDEAS